MPQSMCCLKTLERIGNGFATTFSKERKTETTSMNTSELTTNVSRLISKTD